MLQLALDDGFVSEGITSGSDASAWDPIQIENEDKNDKKEDVLNTEPPPDEEPAGVTSGNDGGVTGDVKTSERKHRDR